MVLVQVVGNHSDSPHRPQFLGGGKGEREGGILLRE